MKTLSEYRNYLKTRDIDHLQRMLDDANLDDGFNPKWRRAIEKEITKRN